MPAWRPIAVDSAQGAVIRRAWSPRLIPGLTTWHRSDIVVLDAGGVSAWNDLSGRGNIARQPFSGPRPIWAASGSMITTRPVLQFDGTKFLTSLGDFPIGARTYFWVAASTTTAEYRVFDHSPNGMFIANFTPQALLSLASSNYRYFADSPAVDDGQAHIFSLEIAGSAAGDITNSRFLVDGAPVASLSTLSTSPPDTWGALRIGSGGVNKFVGEMAEFIIFDRVVSAVERQRIEGYLKRRYGIA